MFVSESLHLSQRRREADSPAESHHRFCNGHSQLLAVERVKVCIGQSGLLEDVSHHAQRLLNCWSKEDDVVGVHDRAGSPMAQDVYQRETGEVPTVGATQHDGIAAQVGGQTQCCASLSIIGVFHCPLNVFHH